VLNGHSEEYFALWVRMVEKHPHAILDNRLCVTSIAWNPETVGVNYTVSRGIDDNPFGLRTVPLSSTLNKWAVSILDFTDRGRVQPWVWRAPTWIYFAYLAVAIAAWRRRRALVLLVGLPILAQQASLLPVNTAQDVRYMVASLLFAVLVLPVAAARPVDDTLARPARSDEEAGAP
jgi:hypothetical protein